MPRRNHKTGRPQNSRRIWVVGVRHAEIDQRKLGRALLRLLEVERGQNPENCRQPDDATNIDTGVAVELTGDGDGTV